MTEMGNRLPFVRDLEIFMQAVNMAVVTEGGEGVHRLVEGHVNKGSANLILQAALLLQQLDLFLNVLHTGHTPSSP